MTCITENENTKYLGDLDVTTTGELISSYITLAFFVCASIFLIRLVKITKDCMKSSKRNIKYLLLVQIVGLLTILSRFHLNK